MKKYPCITLHGIKPVKRSITMQQIEVMWLISDHRAIEKHRSYFNLSMAFPGREFAKGITVKRIPLGYMNKFL